MGNSLAKELGRHFATTTFRVLSIIHWGYFKIQKKQKKRKYMGEIPELIQREDPARVKASTGQIFNSIQDRSYFTKLLISSDTHCRRARNCNSSHFGDNKLYLRRAYCCPLTNIGPPEMQTFTVKELKDFFQHYK